MRTTEQEPSANTNLDDAARRNLQVSRGRPRGSVIGNRTSWCLETRPCVIGVDVCEVEDRLVE
jgi:hypothetical protein